MALDLRQNCVSVQYLKNKWTEFYQILYKIIIFPTFVPELWPLI